MEEIAGAKEGGRDGGVREGRRTRETGLSACAGLSPCLDALPVPLSRLHGMIPSLTKPAAKNGVGRE